jgi:hypothetical protein
MLSERSRVLFLLILLSVVAAAGWSTALASGKAGPSTVSSSLASLERPPAVPASGEPDVGQTPRPEITRGALLPGPRGEAGGSQGSHADRWIRWVFRMWTIRYLGAR